MQRGYHLIRLYVKVRFMPYGCVTLVQWKWEGKTQILGEIAVPWPVCSRRILHWLSWKWTRLIVVSSYFTGMNFLLKVSKVISIFLSEPTSISSNILREICKLFSIKELADTGTVLKICTYLLGNGKNVTLHFAFPFCVSCPQWSRRLS